MAISLKQYQMQVTPSAAKTGVEGSVQLAGQAAGGAELMAAELVSDLGNAAVSYFEKKQEIKDAADSADYKSRLLRLQTDLETAKGDALESGVDYKDIYSSVYTPMLDEFRLNTINAGYSDEILNAALTNFEYDREAIRQSELADVERVDLANLTVKLQEGAKDHYAAHGYGKDPIQDAKFDNTLDHYAGIVGQEQAGLFKEQIIVQDLNSKIATAVASSTSTEEKLAVLKNIDVSNLTPDNAEKLKLDIAVAENEITAAGNKVFQEAKDEITTLMATDKFDFLKYQEIKNDLPPTDQRLLDQYVIQQAEVETKFFLKFKETQDEESVKIMDWVSRFDTGESIIKRNAFQRFFTDEDEPLTYGQVYDRAETLSAEGKAVLYIAMQEAMKRKAETESPLEVYGHYMGAGATPLQRLNPAYNMFEPRELKFDDVGKDFLQELFYYAETMQGQNLMGWTKTTLSNFFEFKKQYPDPTPEQYSDFKHNNFSQAAARRVQSLTSDTGDTSVTPDQRQIITNAKGR